MNKNTLIEKIKTQLKALVNQKFTEVKAGDLMITSPDEELIIGSEVYTIDEEGNNIPLVDGEYTLDSGIRICVVAGKITEMYQPDAEKPEVNTEMEADKPEDNEEKSTEDKPEDEMLKRLVALEEKVEEMVKKYEEVVEEKEKMKAEFSKFSELPSTQSIENTPAEFKSVKDKISSVNAPDIMAIREKARKNR